MVDQKYVMKFQQMQQKELYKFINWFINDPSGFYTQVSVMVKTKYEDFPDKNYVNVKDERHLQFYVTRFLVSIIMMFARNILQSISPRDVKYMIGVDQLGFILSVFKQGDKNILMGSPEQVRQAVQNVKKKQPYKMSHQVAQLMLQVFGKQYFKEQQKRKMQIRIQHGGRAPVRCTMGLDISTAVVGICIFQNTKKKPVFLDAVLLTKQLNKRKLQNTLINKLMLFKQYMQDVLQQKNIEITNLYIQQERKRFGKCTNANTLNKLRKFNGMISGYMFQRLKQLQQVSYINVRSRRKMVFGKRYSKQQSYQKFKVMYKDILGQQYAQCMPKQSNKDRSDSFIIGMAGIIGGGHIAKRKDRIKRDKNKTG